MSERSEGRGEKRRSSGWKKFEEGGEGRRRSEKGTIVSPKADFKLQN